MTIGYNIVSLGQEGRKGVHVVEIVEVSKFAIIDAVESLKNVSTISQRVKSLRENWLIKLIHIMNIGWVESQ